MSASGNNLNTSVDVQRDIIIHVEHIMSTCVCSVQQRYNEYIGDFGTFNGFYQFALPYSLQQDI